MINESYNTIPENPNKKIFNEPHSEKKELELEAFFKLAKELFPEISEFNKDLNSSITFNQPQQVLTKNTTISTPQVDNNFNVYADVPFAQGIITWSNELTKELTEIRLRFSGLCELICNKILIDDLLGKGETGTDYFKEKITIHELNKESILKSHLIDVYSIFHRFIAIIFRIYPDNIFSTVEQWNLVQDKILEQESFHLKEVNEKILFEGLDKIENGTTLKLEIFKYDFPSFSGHSLLIKKVDENEYIFFDPNEGEFRGLDKNELKQKIDSQLRWWSGTDLLLTKGNVYLQRLREQKIVDIFQTNIA